MVLNHPNIIDYIDAFKKQSSIYIVTKHIDGLTLNEYIKALKERVDYDDGRTRRYLTKRL